MAIFRHCLARRAACRFADFEHLRRCSVSIAGKILAEPLEVFLVARAGQARKDVIDGEEEPLFSEVNQQGDQIVAALLNLHVLALGQVVHADVNFRAAGHLAGDLFADEKIVVLAQLLGAFDRIVLGERDRDSCRALSERRRPRADRCNFRGRICERTEWCTIPRNTSGREGRISCGKLYACCFTGR